MNQPTDATESTESQRERIERAIESIAADMEVCGFCGERTGNYYCSVGGDCPASLGDELNYHRGDCPFCLLAEAALRSVAGRTGSATDENHSVAYQIDATESPEERRAKIERWAGELASDLTKRTSTLAENSYDPAHNWVCGSCDYSSDEVLSFTKLENHDTECKLRRVAEAALRSVAGQRTEVCYVNPLHLSRRGEGDQYLWLWRGDQRVDTVPVQLSWDAPEDSDG